MTTLMTSEWYKLLRGRVLILVLAGVSLETLVQVLSAYSVGDASLLGQDGVTMAAGKSFVLQIWFAAFAGFFVASEFQHGTVRHALALGKNRFEVYLSKLSAVCIAVAALLAAVSLVGTAGLTAAFGFGGMTPGEYARFFAWHYGMQLVYHLAYGAIMTMFAFLSRNTGLTILLGIGYMIATQVAIAYLGDYSGGRLAFAAEWFPQYYVSRFAYLSGDAAFAVKGAVVSAVTFAAAGIIGAVAFKQSDIK